MHLNKYLLKKKAMDPAMADVQDVGYATDERILISFYHPLEWDWAQIIQ